MDPAALLGLDDDFLAMQLRLGLVLERREREMKAVEPEETDRTQADLDRIAKAREMLGG